MPNLGLCVATRTIRCRNDASMPHREMGRGGEGGRAGLRKESSVMEERLRFVARLLDGEPMTDVCREFGISRKTGYKIFNRYREHGCEAFSDRSRRPVRYANQLPQQVESLIVTLKRGKPHWGARKIR